MEAEGREKTTEGRIDSRHSKRVMDTTQEGDIVIVMETGLAPGKLRLWKDRFMGTGLLTDDKTETPFKEVEEDDLGLLEGDIKKTSVNDISAIEFSKRITQLLIKDMEHTVVIKLLGRNIGYTTLQNKIHFLWQPSQPFRLMDIEKGYYLAKFRNPGDYERVLSQGLWIVYGQYLTVQPWSIDFNLSQPYPNMVMAWIQFPGLPRHMYKRKTRWEIGGMIGRVIKLDFNTDNGVRGRFARMTVFVNLGKAFISQVLINVVLHRIEYEYLLTVCFSCGHYRHSQEICPRSMNEQQGAKRSIAGTERGQENESATEKNNPENSFDVYGPWMLVEKRNRRWSKERQ
ncbi:hypothetical protein GOBAR_AA30618 [Gossypium barbadense]|uniref:DUF4283 domain-containing protein n=1 Tax=Gossypium barbadense TaxID=3634 RepID=A0A2P5WG50_GOSBA|nr:hypothetical protein GOBAR_AA30618 [Gossypium barbadense]